MVAPAGPGAPAPPGRFVASQLATLALSLVRVEDPHLAARAAAWHNAAARLGLHLPLFAVHDLGLLLSQPAAGGGGPRIAPRPELLARLAAADGLRRLLDDYAALLVEVERSDVVQRAASFRLRDEVVVALLAKLLSPLYQRWPERTKGIGAEELPLSPELFAEADVAALWTTFDQQPALGFLRHLLAERLHLAIAVEQIDLDTLRLLGLFRGEGRAGAAPGGAGGLDLPDLLAVLASPEANDVVNFSLELLPSVLETKRQTGVQAFAVDGYASIERRGNLDSLVLTEIAADDDLFERRVVDDELYYYGHEKQREDERRLQYVLIDASASMRGEREVFARGLALTLAKKLSLQGEEVWLRFFDSRLYEVMRVSRGGELQQVPYLLGFRSERGRNYGRVFRQLRLELERLAQGDRRRVVLYLLTHGQCHVPLELAQQLARSAFLYGVFILPSAALQLEWLPALHRHQVVDAETLASRERRARRALEIVGEAGRG